MQKEFKVNIAEPEPLGQIPYDEFLKSVIEEWNSLIDDEDNQDTSIEITTELKNGSERTYIITSEMKFNGKTYGTIEELIEVLYSYIIKNNEIIMYIDFA